LANWKTRRIRKTRKTRERICINYFVKEVRLFAFPSPLRGSVVERVHIWNTYRERVLDPLIDTTLDLEKKPSKSHRFCSLETLLHKASTPINEVMRFSRF
jgi:hypothetical protein